MDAFSVLLVDDEEEFASTLAERLSLRGIQASTASNGAMALSLIEADPPQVVLLDVMMPGMGGIEVLERIRATHPGLQVILLTGHGCTRDGTEGLRLGAFDCLMKPLNIDELIERVGSAIRAAGV